MKRIFTLLLAMSAMTVAMAQRGQDRDRSRDVILGQGNRNVYDNNHRNDSRFTAREREEQIARIRREYNWKIESVKRERYMRNGEKRRQIRLLENERDVRIRKVWERYNRTSRDYRRY